MGRRLTGQNINQILSWLSSVEEFNHALNSAEKSVTVDGKWYLAEYPEVAELGISAAEHYDKFGWIEGRHPRFDAEWYLEQYPDVALAGVDPLEHYIRHGRDEFRHPAFNATWYKLEYCDVAKSALDPKKHYQIIGKQQGRHPAFNKAWYIKAYQDVVDAGFDVYYHYLMNGRGEGRTASFCDEWYVKEYPDSLQMPIPPQDHFFLYGRAAGYRAAPQRKDVIDSVRLSSFPSSVDTEYQVQQRFDNKVTDVKAISFYLPQFHETAENNRWWGEGFTEWTNTQKSQPRFSKHYQPRAPHDDIGYYDLSQKESLLKQVDLAKKHGIYGFCLYHYWFSGERLLSTPLDVIFNNKDIDINFCLCWAMKIGLALGMD